MEFPVIAGGSIIHKQEGLFYIKTNAYNHFELAVPGHTISRVIHQDEARRIIHGFNLIEVTTIRDNRTGVLGTAWVNYPALLRAEEHRTTTTLHFGGNDCLGINHTHAQFMKLVTARRKSNRNSGDPTLDGHG